MGHPGTSHGDERSRANDEFAPQAAQSIEVIRSCWLGPEAEDKVLRLGLLAMREALGTEGLLEFPRRPNGAPRLMRQGFFERLLREQTNLKECAAADISAAEADIRHLALTQLLAIRCMNFEFAVTDSNQLKASFISLIDRWTMTSIAQRLLGDEILPDAHCSVVIRHAVLIYGANRQLMTQESSAGSDWWLLAVGGTRRYLNLPRCEMSSSVPQGHVYCYRSHSAADPRDPRRSRVFRWQALLVATPASWTEDPLSFEQRSKKTHQLRDVAAKPASTCVQQGVRDATAAPSEAFGLFDTNFTNLCDQAERELDELFGDVVSQSESGQSDRKSGAVIPVGTDNPGKKDAPLSNLCMQAELELDALFDSANAVHAGTCNFPDAEHSTEQPKSVPDVADMSLDGAPSVVTADAESKADPSNSCTNDKHRGQQNVDDMFDSFMSELDQLGSSQLDKPTKAGASSAPDSGNPTAWSSSAAAAIDDFCGSLLDSSVDQGSAAPGTGGGALPNGTLARDAFEHDGVSSLTKPSDHGIEGEKVDIAKESIGIAPAATGVEAPQKEIEEAEQQPNSYHAATSSLSNHNASKVQIWDSKWLILLVAILACLMAALLGRAR